MKVFDIQGHRGCRGLMPENTIPGMLKAIDFGVNTLEMDVCFTADHKAVLSHEPFFSHLITTKPDGTAVTPAEERSLNIYQMNYDEVKRYDVGLKQHPGFSFQQKLPAYKPLLSEVIDACESYIEENKLPLVYYNIETKTNASTDNQYHPEPSKFIDLLMEVVEKKEIGNRVIVQSFDVRTLQYLKNKYPAISIALLIEEQEKMSVEEKIKTLGFKPDIVSPEYTMVDAGLVDYCHLGDMKVVPWTVNDTENIRKLKALKVDGIISDYPNLL